MSRILLHTVAAVLVLAVTWSALPAAAAEAPDLTGLCAESRSAVLDAVAAMAKAGRLTDVPALEALLDRRVGTDNQGRCLMLTTDEKAVDLATGQPLSEKPSIEPTGINNRVRSVAKKAISQLRLASPDRETRLAAARELDTASDEALIAAIETALAKETDPEIKGLLAVTLSQIDLGSPDAKRQLRAIATIAGSGNTALVPNLRQVLTANPPAAPEVVKAAQAAIDRLERKLALVRTLRDLFYGVSLGSVLLLAALGLAITFGLMGVINMAHGEMLMLGAYATYVVQQLFRTYLPGAIDYYLLAAIPFAFGLSFAVGVVLERTILRFLYGRPLETLLATWGISLGLIQTVRLIFGAQNVEVQNPSWLSGGIEVLEGLTLTYNRIAIIVFVILVVFLCWAMLNRTSLGLQVRAVTQDRNTAKAMGIFTWKVDMWTFALGSGIAGLGGLALTQVGNVGPELGQGYIVDSFMVVVLGGVGKLIGTVVGALGLGMINKALEPFMGAVLGKIIVLALIIVFIQKRPQGLFAFKGRAAD